MTDLLFTKNIRIISDTCGSTCLEIMLDPEELYLKHHSIHEKPLLGTVISLEIIAECIFLLSGKRVTAFRNIISGTDLFLSGTARLICRVTGSQAILSHADGGFDLTMLFCTGFSFADHSSLTGRMISSEISEKKHKESLKRVCSQAEIYSQLFHGPCFQVIDSVRVFESFVETVFNMSVPAFSVVPYSVIINPRIIEFALQTSGMLDMLIFNENKVPESTGEILFKNDYSLQLNTAAAPLCAAAVKIDGTNCMQVTDASGHVIVSVKDYRTKNIQP